MTSDEQYMNARQQNYLFAYNLVPALLFRSDIAKVTAHAHPQGFQCFQQYWERLASVFPDEHVVSNELLATETYQLSEGIYCMVVTMPPTERYLEVQYLGIVFHPKVRYFVAGRSDMPDMGPQTWTVREVTPSGHGRCGMLEESNPEDFLTEITQALRLEPNIRIAGEDEMRENAKRIETFPAKFQMTPPEAVLVMAATYKVISLKMGDTSGMPASAVMQIFQEGGKPMQKVVMAILNDAQQNALVKQKPSGRSPFPKKKWWHFWS